MPDKEGRVIKRVISTGRVTLVFFCLVMFFMLAGTTSAYLRFALGDDGLHHYHLRTIIEQFDLDGENNLPNYYQSVSMLFCAWLLLVISDMKKKIKDRYLGHWRFLAVVFLFLSMDESAQLHEMIIEPLRDALHTSGAFYFAWVIPGLIFVTIMGLAYLPFVWKLPSRTKWLFILAGMIYLNGALGLEMVGGYLMKIYGKDSSQYVIETIAEESLEMLGILIFINALMGYLNGFVEYVIIGFDERITAEK